MRVSVIKTDPGFKNFNPKLAVKLDGDILDHCITADEEKGEAHVNVVNEDGKLVVEGSALKTEILKGKVEIFEVDE